MASTNSAESLLFASSDSPHSRRILQHLHRQFPQTQFTELSLADIPELRETETQYDASFVLDNSSNFVLQQHQTILGDLKNRLSSQVLYISENSIDEGDENFRQLIALGFTRESALILENNTFTCFGYNIETYNHKRSWNNSKFWANPENFDKYRW